MPYACVLQHSEEDCGAACLATVAKHYGRTFTLARMREAVGTGSRGTTLLGLRRGAETIGFQARQAQATTAALDHINDAPLPLIVHWQGNHWVVLFRQRGRKFVIADPAVGVRYISRQELLAGWSNGLMLVLQPDADRFYLQPNDKVGGLGRFLRRVWPYRWTLVQALVINLAIGLLALAMPMMMQLLTDDVLVRGDLQLLTTVAIVVMAMNVFRSIIGLIQSQLIGNFSQRLQLGLTLDYGFNLLRLPLAYFDAHRSGEVIGRLGDVRTINNLIGQIVLGLPSQFFIAIVSLGLMIAYSWQLTIAAFGAFIVVTLVNLLFLPALRQQTQRLIVEGTENQGFLVETFRSALVLKTTQATPQVWDEYQQNFGRLTNLGWKTMQLGLYSSTLTSAIGSLVSIGLLWFGSYLTIDKTLTTGQLIAFNGMSGNFLGFLAALVGVVDEFITAQIVIARLSEVLDATPEEVNASTKPWVSIADRADINCSQINFHHSGRVDLLKDFTLTIPGGRTIALIGASGCGKSTLAKLIAGLYPISSGNIRYGLYNQQDLSLECLRQQVVLVAQDAQFWSRSIVDNFRISYPYVSFENIIWACKIAGADEFIGELPDKYQTILGEFGANISGGQKQRLALARAIVTSPPILILDESTSALDPSTETQVLDRLLCQREGKTTIIISHRPRVISRSDTIVHLDRGELKLVGSPQDLLKIPGTHLDFLWP